MMALLIYSIKSALVLTLHITYDSHTGFGAADDRHPLVGNS